MSWVILIIFFFIMVALIVSMWKYSNWWVKKTYGIPELLYYSTQIIGVFATTAAVIVALFNREIRGYLFKEKVNISLVEGGIREILGDTAGSASPKAQSYDCSLVISNGCSKEVENLQIFLKDVFFRQYKNSKPKNIFSMENNALYWRIPENKSTDLGVDETKRIPLFKIYPAASCQTPDSSKVSELKMRIIGCKIAPKYQKKGIWRIIYQIRTTKIVLKEFELTVEWTGDWYNRKEEMSDCVDVVIKEI